VQICIQLILGSVNLATNLHVKSNGALRRAEEAATAIAGFLSATKDRHGLACV
jgi:hypothetical protein